MFSHYLHKRHQRVCKHSLTTGWADGHKASGLKMFTKRVLHQQQIVIALVANSWKMPSCLQMLAINSTTLPHCNQHISKGSALTLKTNVVHFQFALYFSMSEKYLKDCLQSDKTSRQTISNRGNLLAVKAITKRSLVQRCIPAATPGQLGNIHLSFVCGSCQIVALCYWDLSKLTN